MKNTSSKSPELPKSKKIWSTLTERFFEPTDIASIVIFRVMFGVIVFLEVWRYFHSGFISRYYIEPTFFFKYLGFEWVTPWPGDGMYLHFVAIGLCAACVASGFLYRIASWLLFLCLAYVFLLDQTRYSNHLYFAVLASLLLAVIPANRTKSIDTHLRPSLHSNSIPTWCLWILRAQMGIVYFFSGLAKLNSDWLQGNPLRHWLSYLDQAPIIGNLVSSEPFIGFASYGLVVFDFTIVPALMWNKTRAWAFATCVVVHLANAWFYSYGIFPITMLAATALFFPPNWPRKVHLLLAPLDDDPNATTKRVSISPKVRKLTIVFLGTYLAFQLFLPVRHYLYPGNVRWTSEGYRFAWQPKLNNKEANYQFLGYDPATKKVWIIDPLEYLTSFQSLIMSKMPDMCHQFAIFLATAEKPEGVENIEIHLRMDPRLDEGDYHILVDDQVDLSKEPRRLGHSDWIYPIPNRKP